MKELIESGKLKLYVTDALPKAERDAITALIKKHPELQSSVEKITREMKGDNQLSKQKNTNWNAMTGWIAAIACMLGLFWTINEKNNLQDDFDTINTQNVVLSEDKDAAQKSLEETTKVLAVFRNGDYDAITLPGNQAVAPNAFAAVYFNAKDGVAIIDASGLPRPPAGKEYQVWSLIMEPLTPSTMGLLNENNAISSELQVYTFINVPETQAFGITLEPKGGSDFPTLAKLYTLGTVLQ